MKRKKILLGLAIFMGLVIGAVIAAPILFKDQIKAAIDEQIAANVNADVLYDIDNFSISILPNFPNLTVSIEELGIIGREPFAGKVLFAIDEFAVEINLWKIIFDDQLSIQSIRLVSPQIFVKVLADGTANYDIMIDTGEATEETAPEEDAGDFSMAIEHWEIIDGHLIYDDASLATYVDFANLNHTGSGNFSLTVFDLTTHTDMLVNQLSYENDAYLTNRHLAMDMVLNMDLDQMKFTFKENKASINEFAFGFDGWVAMPADDIDMDISFAAKDNSFKSLLSIIPAMYTEDYSDLTATGSVSFNGLVKGTYNDTQMPAYDVTLKVEDGEFHYPDLPDAVSNVQVSMNIASKDGNIDHTSINIDKFHIDFGQEPFDGHLKIDNLINYPVDMALKTTLNLSNLNKMFPVENLAMEGIFKADMKVNGVYDSVKSIIPKIEASMSLEDGNFVYTDLPAPLSDFNFNALIQNTTGKLNDTRVSVPEFSLSVDGSPLKGALLLEEMDDPHWEAAMEGVILFDKFFPIIDRIYPMPGTSMGGSIAAMIKSEGRMSDLDAERYERLTTSGLMSFDKFTYTDSLYLPQGMTIESGEFSFTPENMQAKNIKTFIGRSDFTFNGKIANYIQYVFNDNETISGTLSVTSKKVDLNEWMTDEETTEEPAPGEEEPYTVIEVPKNIDFVMAAKMDEVIYDNMVLRDAQGKIIVKDGMLIMDNLKTSTLGGVIVFDGTYSTTDPEKPMFDMVMDIQSIKIKDSYATFNTIQTLAPVAQSIDGMVSTKFSLKGLLQPDMMPDMATLNGFGLLNIANATMGNSAIVSGLTNYVKNLNANNLTLKDMAMSVSIEDGKLQVKPFDLKINGYKANVGGYTSLDGSINYAIKMEIPAGQAGKEVNALLSSLSGKENTGSEMININLGLTGSYNKPLISLLGTDNKALAKDIAVNQLVNLTGGDKSLADSLQNTDVKEVVDEQKKLAEEELKRQQDSLKVVAEQEAEKAKQKAIEEANKQLKNLFGPKKKKNNNNNN